MGLSISVGILADLAENDPDSVEDVGAEFDIINEVLRQHGLPEHLEPTSLSNLDDRSGCSGFPHSFLHYLRRFYATWVAEAKLPPPILKGERAAHDDVLSKIGSPKHHLLWHSDCEGYYVPIDFPEVLEGEGIAKAGIGSSVRLMEELILVAAPLGIVLDDRRLKGVDAQTIAEENEDGGPYWIERLVWLTLFEAARLSIEHRAAIHFG